jgi:CBS domain containing-hemolysin-like protein
MPEDGLSPAIGLPIALFLVLVNAFFVAAEFAIVKVRHTRLAELAATGNPAARQAQAIVGHLDAYLAATQLGITIASLGLGWIGEPAVASVLEPLLRDSLGLPETAVHVVAFGLGFGLITVFHITLGELAPKSIAILRPEATSLVIAWPLRAFTKLMWPAIWLLNGAANLLLRLVGLRAASERELAHSEEELRLLLASSGEHGILDPIEQELASRSLALGELRVREVMVPRTELDALAADLSLAEARRHAIAAGRGRLPVYRASVDDVVGYVKWSDLFVTDDPAWVDRVRSMPSLPETIAVSDGLARLREERAELALVLDEYGGTAGILAVRDVLAEITARERPFAGAVLPGSTPLHLLERLSDIVLEDGQAATIGGYVTARLGHVPRSGERVSAGAWDIVVEQATDHRIVSTRLVRRGSSAGPGQATSD